MVSADLLSDGCVGSAGAALPLLKRTGEHLDGRSAGYPLQQSHLKTCLYFAPVDTTTACKLLTIWARQQQDVVCLSEFELAVSLGGGIAEAYRQTA